MSADDLRATQTVQTILSDPAINGIDFMMGDITVSKTMYDKVSKAIQDGKITVLVLPAGLQPNIAAKYLPVLTFSADREYYNIILLRSPDLGTGINQQLEAATAIVHECTHAGFDLLQMSNMAHFQDEAGAYVAGAMFGVSAIRAQGGHPEKVTQHIASTRQHGRSLSYRLR
jgi:hypothetical protein